MTLDKARIDKSWLNARAEDIRKVDYIDPALYRKYNVKRGLRDEDGRGVLTGLTRVAEIQSYDVVSTPQGEKILPADGTLYYRGIDATRIVEGSGRFAFEETAYLLLFGELPNEQQLKAFCQQCSQQLRQ